MVPEAHGGMGFDLRTYVAALEELSWGEPGVALMVAYSTMAAQLIQQLGAEQQKASWLEAIARGELLPCFALAEDAAGSDLNSITTRAEHGDSGWTLNGRKAWVSNAERAQLALVLADSAQGKMLFALPRAAGWTVGPRASTLGLRTLGISTLELNGVKAENVHALGTPVIDQTGSLTGPLGSLSIAAISVGIAQAALDHAVAYANEREQFSRKLRMFEGLQYKLADMATRTEAARALTLHAATQGASLAQMAKLFGSETAMWVTTNAVQIFGGYGYMRDYPVEKLMRDAKAMELLEGANELLRVSIAEALYE
jgi:alkylation response protein AidB-like acyl-CoA dehydrogenase